MGQNWMVRNPVNVIGKVKSLLITHIFENADARAMASIAPTLLQNGSLDVTEGRGDACHRPGNLWVITSKSLWVPQLDERREQDGS
jgi:hypothetical protein